MDKIGESDWKRFRELYPVVMERFSQRTLQEINSVVMNERESAHDRICGVSEVTKTWNKKLGQLFDTYSRSNAAFQLLLWWNHGLIGAEDLASFSEEIQARIPRAAGATARAAKRDPAG